MNEFLIGDLITLQRGFDLSKDKMKNGPYPVVGSNGIIGYHNEYSTIGPCVVIGRSGNAGSVSFINKDFWAHNTTLFVKDFKGNFPKYIYYLLKLIDVKSFAGGSAVPTLNRNILHQVSIMATKDIDKQTKIADILSSFDEKIEKNNEAMQVYQNIIRYIFKNWFIDFNFLDNLGELEDCIPKDWVCSNVFDNIIEVKEKNKENNDYPVLSVVKEGEFKLSDDVFTKQVYSKKTTNYKIVKRNQVAYNPARANIGSIAMLTDFDAGLVSPIYVVFEMKETITPTFFYYYMKQPMFLENIKHHAIGTTRQNFPFEAFKFFDIIVPPMDLQLRFEEIAKPIEQKIAKLKEENAVLAEIRDTLLPKLISGELPVEVGEA